MRAPRPPEHLLRRFALCEARLLTRTAQADLWIARRGAEAAVDGVEQSDRPVVLKHYRSGSMGNEASGVLYLRRAGGDAVVHLLAESPDAVVLDYLAGPSLGDLAREGQPEAADQRLAELAQHLRQCGVSPTGLLPIRALFAPLMQARDQGAEIEAARQVALGLFAQERASGAPPVALHGDLHHDNVLCSPAGYRAIDPKGLAGPRAYELANGFRHPRGCRSYALQEAVMSRRLHLWSAACACAPQDLLRWAVAKTALSMIWSAEARREDAPLLARLLAMLGQGLNA